MTETDAPRSIRIFIDADACPVKAEIYKVAERYGLPVFVVSNAWIAVPRDPRIERVVVGDGFDAADDWIASRTGVGDIVVTADIPLADRCLKAGAAVIGPSGLPFTVDSIGMAMAARALTSDLRAMGEITGGPKPMTARDRSRFLSALDEAVQRLRRARRPA
ncbi:MAG TPA: YaiI/YqxD family protein [Vineibacter sp.]|nr:YaiI/YqxD family protein [Vineibacter sp.]